MTTQQAMTSICSTPIANDTFIDNQISFRPLLENKEEKTEDENRNFSRGEILKAYSDTWRESQGWVTMPLDGKKPIFKNWSDPSIFKTSEYILTRTWDKWKNIGLVTGIVSNVFVVDIDTKDGGVEDWNAHIARYGEPQTLKVLTGGGGFHYYFRFEDKMKHFQSVTACAISDDEKKMAWDMRTTGGQVVIPPSIHPRTKIEYQWADLTAEINLIPDWLFDLFNRYFEQQKYHTVNQILNAPKQIRSNVTTEGDIIGQDILIKILNLLNPERVTDYTLWRDVVWSIHAISEDYLDIAHLFSQQSLEKYKDGSGVNDVWDDWKDYPGGIKAGSLFHWLRHDIGDEAYFKFRRENGFSVPMTLKVLVSRYDIDDPYYVKDFLDDISRKVFEGNTSDEAYKKAKAFVYPRMCRVARVITSRDNNVVLKISKLTPFVMDCEINKFGGYGKLYQGYYKIKYPIPKKLPTDLDTFTEVDQAPFSLLLNNRELVLESIVNDPYHFDIGNKDLRTLNTFPGFKARLVPNMTLEEAKIICAPMLDHIFYVWADRDIILYLYLMEWLARPIRDLTRTNIMLSIVGKQGCGKSIVFDFLRDFVIGDKVCLTITGGLSDITGNFNEMLPGTIIAQIDETATAGQPQGLSLSQYEILKTLTTNDVILIKEKYKNARNVKNYCSFAITSNNSQPVIVVDGDRRNAIIECSDHLIGNWKYFENLANEFPKMGNEFYTLLRLWPNNINLKKIPNTNARQIAIEESKLQGNGFFNEYILDGSEAIDSQFIHFKRSWKNTVDEKRVFILSDDLYDYYKGWHTKTNNGKLWSSCKFIKEAKTCKGLIHHSKFIVDIIKTQKSYFEIPSEYNNIVKIAISRYSPLGSQPTVDQKTLQEWIDYPF